MLNTATTHQTQNNPIPLIKPQPPLPIIIQETTFRYEDTKLTPGEFRFFLSSGMLVMMFDNIKIETETNGTNYVWVKGILDGSVKIIAWITLDKAALLSVWIDRCKGNAL
ncbi:MAG: hypothetical protein ISEC1_P1948 [Thiomicrorhabdus sp.]|nr:MAG: hypothetical protein ISEC1_P1948 [Thiomicrorhabdus sp.]